MIELPRAALMAGEIAEVADFFSFGTNEISPNHHGPFAEDGRARFLPDYVDEKKAGCLCADPFQSLDIKGLAC